MNLSHKKNVILNLIEQAPGTGKTAVMKAVFLLQQVKGLSVGYDFSIYTYGPYSAQVTEDVDQLVSQGLITASMYPYQNYIGYSLDISDMGKEKKTLLTESENASLQEIMDFVSKKSAKELELFSTIIYVHNLYTKNNWGNDAQTVISKVKEIKPHFNEKTIKEALQELQSLRYLT